MIDTSINYIVTIEKLNDEDDDGRTWFMNAEESIVNKAEVI
jgi:hypothetical protein